MAFISCLMHWNYELNFNLSRFIVIRPYLSVYPNLMLKLNFVLATFKSLRAVYTTDANFQHFFLFRTMPDTVSGLGFSVMYFCFIANFVQMACIVFILLSC